MYLKRFSRYLFFLTAFSALCFAQSAEFSIKPQPIGGKPVIKNYDAKTYGAFPQNWSIVQDNQGIMFFGNGVGVLKFDGISWELIPIRNKSGVFSLALDRTNNRIYVGGGSEFGYLAPDNSGRLRFLSLKDSIPAGYQKFNEIWQTFVTEHGVFFIANEGIFQWQNGRIFVHQRLGATHVAYYVNQTIYIKKRGAGLYTFNGEKFIPIPGGKLLEGASIYGLYRFDDKRVLICTTKRGYFLYDGHFLHTFPVASSVVEYLQKHRKYLNGTALADGRFAFGTRSGGLLIVNREGEFVQSINKQDGLQGNTVWATYQDREGGLWLALDNGLSRIEIASPVSIFDERTGIKGRVHAMIRHQNTLYIGTRLGVYFFDENSQRFTTVEGVRNLSSQFLSFKIPSSDAVILLVATSQGVFQIDGDKSRVIRPSIQRDFYTHALHQSQLDSNRIFVGFTRGLAVLRYDKGRWIDEGKFAKLQSSVRSFLEVNPGELWIGNVHTPLKGHYQFPASLEKTPWTFRDLSEVPIDGRERVAGGAKLTRINNTPYTVTMEGIFRYNTSEEAFIRDKSYEVVNQKLAKIFEDYVLQEDNQNAVWVNLGGESAQIIPSTDGDPANYSVDKIPYLSFADNSVGMVYPDIDGSIWFGGADGLIRYNPAIRKDYQQDFQVIIRQVALGEDSLIHSNFSSISDSKNDRIGKLAFSSKPLQFQYAALSFQDTDKNQYQTYLKGFDPDWSSWQKSAKRSYTNLPEGNYTFHVRARNIYMHQSNEATYHFSISPPWFRTWWAYTFYLILFMSAIFATIRYRERRIRQRTRQLEEVVANRTREVRKQKDQLAEQAEDLKALDKVKTRFFANISHEFRTPLTLIMGPVGQLKEEILEETAQQKLSIVERNSQRLHRLINQLLDLSRLEEDRLALTAAPGNIVEYVTGLVMGFSSWAEQKNVALTVVAHQQRIDAVFDRDVIDKAVNNLLSNALKFTPAEGEVKVIINRDTSTANAAVKIIVQDSGIGIPADRLPHIFDRFYQVDGTSTREYEGTGIGLALTKELIERHYGTIAVASELGNGSIFTITLPLGERHFLPGEVIAVVTKAKRVTANPQDIYEDSKTISTARISSDVEISRDTSESSQTNGVNYLPDHLSASTEENLGLQKILIVEDHSDFRHYIRDCLRKKHKKNGMEYKFVEAGNGREGLQKALAHIPDLIISDVMMPGMNGYQLSEAIKAENKTNHIPIILLTAKASLDDKLTGLTSGADDYLSKPFDARELSMRVNNLLTRRRNLQTLYQQEFQHNLKKVSTPSVEQKFLQEAAGIIEAQIEDETFSVEKLARELGMSRTQLHRKLNALTGESSSHFIRSIRLQRAADLLRQNVGNITEIAFMVGFSSQPYFTKCFQKYYGMSPKRFQKKHLPQS